MANLNELMTNIANAIRTKKGTTETINAQNFPSEIESIETGGGGDNLFQEYINNKGGDGIPSATSLFQGYAGSNVESIVGKCDFSKVISCGSMFYGCKTITSISISINSSKSMSNMFYGCTNLISANVYNTGNNKSLEYAFSGCSNLKTISNMDTTFVTKMNNLFYGCENLESDIDFISLNNTDLCNAFYNCKKIKNIHLSDTQNTTDFYQAFINCNSLLSISPLNTNKAKSGRMENMFGGCYLLPTIDITKLIDNSSYFAYNCYSLTKLIIRTMETIPTLSSNAFNNCYHFTGTTNATYNPTGAKDGRIYVPDDKLEELKVATNWSVYADIIKPLSLENGDHIGSLMINNYTLSLATPRKATIYLEGFTNTPTVSITISNESVAQINNITTTTEKITFEVIALGVEDSVTITVNVSGDYSKTLTCEVYYVAPMEYTVEAIDGVTYGFTLNSNEYYESTNKKISSSYSLCKLVFNTTELNNCLKLECINSGEGSYDFGILSNIDTTLSLNNNIDSTNVYNSFSGKSSTTPVTITYPEATVGEHFIYIKYRKDGSGDNGNDSLQFKVIS